MVSSTSRCWSGREGRHLPSGGPALAFAERDREVANRGGTRPTRAHRRAARCHTLARSENRPRVRAKAVRNHVSLCFSSVSCGLVHRCPLSIYVTHQPDTPATGPSACNPACSGLSNLTYLPTASAGSEALPSLARRVSMQQHAELPCRDNSAGVENGTGGRVNHVDPFRAAAQIPVQRRC